MNIINKNFNSYVIKDYNRNYDNGKKFIFFVDKIPALKDFFNFLNQVLGNNSIFKIEEKFFANDKISIDNQVLGDVSDDNLAKIFNLLFHLKKCHNVLNETCNDTFGNQFALVLDGLVNETADIFRCFDANFDLENNRKLIKEFLFLIAHRDGQIHTKNDDYAKKIGTYRKQLLEQLKAKVEKNLNEWAASHRNVYTYVQAKKRIIDNVSTLNPVLDLSGLILTNLPKCVSYLSYIKDLNLSGNRLRMYDDIDDEHTILFLVKNNMKIEQKAFKYLINLNKIDLSNNIIREIIPGTFDEFRNLEVINLNNNKIREIIPGTFDQMNKLESINLSNNNIFRIKENTFKINGNNLKTLNLSGNLKNIINIDDIQDNIFKNNIFNNLNNMKIIHQSYSVNSTNEVITHPIECSFRIE